MQVMNVRTQSCEVVETDNETYIRYDSNNWEVVMGMSTEVVNDPRQIEEAYQEYVNRCNHDE